MNTMSLYKNIVIILVFLLSGFAVAQQEPNYTLYRYTMNVINPAYAGAGESDNLTSSYRNQWVNIEGSPETQTFFYSRKWSNKMGIGLSVVNDKVFVESQTSFNVDFSYHLQLSRWLNLYLGLKAGGSTYKVDQGGLNNYGLQGDPVLGNIDEAFRPNFGAGAYLVHDKYFVSLSVPRILSSKRIDESEGRITQATQEAHIYLSGGYNVSLSDNTEFRPSTMIRYVGGSPLSLELTGAFRFYEKFEVGLAYRTDQAIGGLMMVNVIDWLDVGYAYGSSTREEITNNSNGTHEIFVRFIFKRRN